MILKVLQIPLWFFFLFFLLQATTLKGLITLDSSESQPVLVREIYFAYAKCYGGKSAISNIYFWPT